MGPPASAVHDESFPPVSWCDGPRAAVRSQQVSEPATPHPVAKKQSHQKQSDEGLERQRCHGQFASVIGQSAEPDALTVVAHSRDNSRASSTSASDSPMPARWARRLASDMPRHGGPPCGASGVSGEDGTTTKRSPSGLRMHRIANPCSSCQEANDFFNAPNMIGHPSRSSGASHGASDAPARSCNA
jgi:hypothetical protein